MAGADGAGATSPRVTAIVAETASVRPALAAAMASAVRRGKLAFGFMISRSEVLSEAYGAEIQ
jgi:hypothetical protein